MDDQTKKSQPARINPKFRPNIVPNCVEDLFFFFFWSSFNLGDGVTLFSLKYFRRPNAFGQGCKASPHAKFYNLSTGFGLPGVKQKSLSYAFNISEQFILLMKIKKKQIH